MAFGQQREKKRVGIIDSPSTEIFQTLFVTVSSKQSINQSINQSKFTLNLKTATTSGGLQRSEIET
jgi:hypothetical protein